MTVSSVHPSLGGPVVPGRIGLPAAADTAIAVQVGSDRDFDDIVDEWGAQSFPASDPPSNW